MNVLTATAKLQEYAHSGRALDEIEIVDKDDNVICLLDDIELSTDEGREVVKLKVHHKAVTTMVRGLK